MLRLKTNTFGVRLQLSSRVNDLFVFALPPKRCSSASGRSACRKELRTLEFFRSRLCGRLCKACVRAVGPRVRWDVNRLFKALVCPSGSLMNCGSVSVQDSCPDHRKVVLDADNTRDSPGSVLSVRCYY